ncbi:Hypothetical_protein [Hexamita inflata]|uniref:Hypothetical_protein n=1 Tax=Hexamita inflata TaxID=28002 RepID=A0AA86P755_9EUKA|nr:Hypothetical protein HINF_LOCUS19240 [Hexamita inflata]
MFQLWPFKSIQATTAHFNPRIGTFERSRILHSKSSVRQHDFKWFEVVICEMIFCCYCKQSKTISNMIINNNRNHTHSDNANYSNYQQSNRKTAQTSISDLKSVSEMAGVSPQQSSIFMLSRFLHNLSTRYLYTTISFLVWKTESTTMDKSRSVPETIMRQIFLEMNEATKHEANNPEQVYEMDLCSICLLCITSVLLKQNIKGCSFWQTGFGWFTVYRENEATYSMADRQNTEPAMNLKLFRIRFDWWKQPPRNIPHTTFKTIVITILLTCFSGIPICM